MAGPVVEHSLRPVWLTERASFSQVPRGSVPNAGAAADYFVLMQEEHTEVHNEDRMGGGGSWRGDVAKSVIPT